MRSAVTQAIGQFGVPTRRQLSSDRPTWVGRVFDAALAVGGHVKRCAPLCGGDRAEDAWAAAPLAVVVDAVVGVTLSIMSARSSMRAPSQPEGRATEASTSWPPVNPMAMPRSAAVRALSGRPASCSARRGGVGRAITQVGQTVRIEVAEVRAEAGVELRVPGLGDPFGGTAEFPQGAAPAAALACPCPATDPRIEGTSSLPPGPAQTFR